MGSPYREGTVAFQITRDDLAERIHSARDTIESLELFADDAGFRDAAKRIYEARFALSAALQALSASLPSGVGEEKKQ